MNSIGVIITVYNKSAWIIRTINSILNQTVSPDQLIIINDCSTDDSKSKIISKISELKNRINDFIFLDLKSNVGAAQARNIALSYIHTEYTTFLDADDQYINTHIETQLKLIKTKPGLVANAVRKEKSQLIYPSRKILRTFTNIDSHYIISRPFQSLSIESFFIGGGNICFKSSLARDIEFVKGESNFEEWDFYYRILKEAINKSYNIIYSDKIGLLYNDTDETSLSRKIIPDFNTIKVPMLIQRLKSREEIGFKKFVISLWIYNSLNRIASWQSRLKFIFKHKKFFYQLPFNRYSLGILAQICLNISIVRNVSVMVKSLRFRK